MSTKERQEKYLQLLSTSDKWYDNDPAVREQLAKVALEVVSACPSQVHSVCETLIKALASGMKDESGAFLHIAGRTFHSRSDLKAECQQLLRRYEDNSHLDETDARFVLELLRHHPRGSEKAREIRAVSAGPHPAFPTRCFFVVRLDGREDFSYLRCIDNAPTGEIVAQGQICEVLCAILQLHPAACEKIARSIEEKFPPYVNRNDSIEKHRNWAQSILLLCARVRPLTEYLLMVLIRRMVEIDAKIHKMEDERPVPAAVHGDQQASDQQALFDHMAGILDAKMVLMFEFLQRHLTGTVGEAENQLAKALLSVFAGTVLLTHRVRCVQFLWFYLASLRPAWAEAFLSLLLQTAYSPHHGMPKRVICFAYLASFLARSHFLPTKYAVRTAQYISTFARENLQAAEFHVTKGDPLHPQVVLVLSAVQALCYLLCFNATSIATEPLGLSSLIPTGGADAGPEAFTPVLESILRPLTRIASHVAREFCKSLRPHRHQLAAALRQQLRATPAAESAGIEEPKEGCFQGEVAGLDGFFPFDPYRLRHSSMFLLGIYREWTGHTDDSESEVEAPGGFQAEAAAGHRAAAASQSGTEDGGDSDADFTDAADAAERGFIPSVGPSPAFRPRSSLDMPDVSPLVVPMESMDDDETFALPQPSIDVGSTIMSHLLNTPAYKAGAATGTKQRANAS